jgi:dolichol-phosphate mannosyltransferase
MLRDHLLLLPVSTGALFVDPIPPISDRKILLSLVIPTYQARDNIANTIKILSAKLDRIIPNAYELIVVDDNSPDLTWQIVGDLTSEYPYLRVLRRTHERGVATAVVRGWQAAKGQVLGVIDVNNLHHPPSVLWRLWEAMEAGADLAIASPDVDGGGVNQWNSIRRYLSKAAYQLGAMILPQVACRVKSPLSGYFLLRRSTIAGRLLSPLDSTIQIEAIGRGKIGKISEIGYEFQEPQIGNSTVVRKQYAEYIQNLWQLRWDRSRKSLQLMTVVFTGLVVDMSIFYLLGDATTLALPLILSKIVAGESAIINSFLWYNAWGFLDRSHPRTIGNRQFQRFFKFNLACAIGLVINVCLLKLVYYFAIPDRYIANLMAIGSVTVWNFWVASRSGISKH